MNPFIDIKTLTASEARAKLFDLLEQTSSGKGAFEIQLRGKGSAILMNKDEFESWLETIDILHSTEEMKVVRSWKRNKKKKTLSHKEILRKLNLEYDD